MSDDQPNRLYITDETGSLVDEDFSWDEITTTTIEDAPYQRAFGTDEFYVLDYVVAKPLVQQYVFGDEVVKLRKTREELRDSQWQIENLPYTLGHPDGRTVTDTSSIHGFWANPRYVLPDEDTEALPVGEEGQMAQLMVPVTDGEAKEFIEANPATSIGFNPTIDWSIDDEEADGIPRNYLYDHIASVKQGRCSVENGCGWEGALADGAIYDGVRTEHLKEEFTITCDECGATQTINRSDWTTDDADICSAGPCSCGRHTSDVAEGSGSTNTLPTTMSDDNESTFRIDSIERLNKGVIIDKHDGISELLDEKETLLDEKDDRIEELEQKVEALQDERDAATERVVETLEDEFDEKVERLCDNVEMYEEADIRSKFEDADSLSAKESVVDSVDEKLELIDEVAPEDDEETTESSSNGLVDDDGGAEADEEVQSGFDVDVSPNGRGMVDLRSN